MTSLPAQHEEALSQEQISLHAGVRTDGVSPQHRLDAAQSERDAQRVVGLLEAPDPEEQRRILEIRERMERESSIRTHYYVKIAVSAFLCMILLVIGVPVFVISRYTGSLSYTALGVVLVGFGLILAVAVIVLLFRPPWRK